MSDAVHVESALFFETPDEIFARVFRAVNPGATLPAIAVEFCEFKFRRESADFGFADWSCLRIRCGGNRRRALGFNRFAAAASRQTADYGDR